MPLCVRSETHASAAIRAVMPRSGHPVCRGTDTIPRVSFFPRVVSTGRSNTLIDRGGCGAAVTIWPLVGCDAARDPAVAVTTSSGLSTASDGLAPRIHCGKDDFALPLPQGAGTLTQGASGVRLCTLNCRVEGGYARPDLPLTWTVTRWSRAPTRLERARRPLRCCSTRRPHQALGSRPPNHRSTPARSAR